MKASSSQLLGSALASLVMGSALAATIAPPDSASKPLRIWQTHPGKAYSDSFLIGNGRIGAALLGNAQSETIQINEDSLWSGGSMDRVNPDAKQYMPDLQSMLRNGEISDAATLASYSYAGTPVSTRHYDYMGSLNLVMSHGSTVTDYERYLDLENSVSGLYYTVGGVTYLRESLASSPDDVIAIRISASKKGSISFNLHLQRGTSLNRWEDYSIGSGDDTIVMGGGSGGTKAVGFAAGAKVVATGGTTKVIGDTVLVDSADKVTIYFTAWTSYRKSDPRASVLSDLGSIGSKEYSAVRSAHISDYKGLAGRTKLNLGTSSDEQKAMNTMDRMTNLTKKFDPELAVLYFNFGKYLFISSSRAGTLPPNLQGIWSQDIDPMWGSKYTININTEMNYWPSLVTNLPELVSPLLDFLKVLHKSGKKTAKAMYNAGGAVAHHNTDMWGDSAPQDNYFSSTFWSGGLAWLSTHIWEYYLFTGDVDTLRGLYPVLKDAATFYLDFMTEYKGWLVTNPSISPENTYFIPNSTVAASITLGPTIDNSLAWEIFGIVLTSESILGETDKGLTKRIQDARSRLPPLRVNKNGGIMEWIEDYQETEIGHRHFSPLIGLFPGSQITASNSTTFKAAASTVERRLSHGGGDTGWSRAWAISLAARLFNETSVGESLVHLMTVLTYPSTLVDTGPPAPFQLDGNYGGTAGVVEALIQSHEMVDSDGKPAYVGHDKNTTPVIRLLPALPKQWAENGGGSAKGLRARGGFELDIAWDEDAKLTKAVLTSLVGNSVWVMVGSDPIGSGDTKQAKINVEGHGKGSMVKLDTQKGKSYSVSLV